MPNLLRTLFAISLLTLCALPATAESDPKPNIIIFLADDMGWADVGFNGGQTIHTPHLDEMAAHSLRFERFYAAAPVCSPTRGSVLTGRHPDRYGIFGANVGHLPPTEHTLFEALAEAGYTTGHFGKWHLGTLTTTLRESNRGGPRGAAHYSPPWDHAVDVSFVTEAKTPTYDPMLRPPIAQGRPNHQSWAPIPAGAPSTPYGTHYWTGPDTMVPPDAPELRGDDSAIIMNRALRFIADAATAETPFLAAIWFHAPHLPVVAGPEHTGLYPDATTYEANYYGCVTALDEQVGRLRAQLRALGVADNTMLCFCSDNGPEGRAGAAPGSAGPLRGRKRDLLEGGIRVPGLIEWPARIRTARTTTVPCGTIDYLPTIRAAAGITSRNPLPLDGIDLLPLLDGAMTQRPAPLAFHSRKEVALIDNRYKILSRDDGATYALYDLVADPGETVDLAERMPDVTRAMAEQAAAWRASCEQSATRDG